ncbi:MAG: argininosuccinate lyase, partial [Nitrospirae bacterium]|nr:argininosuccinate lyase [Nitrospirota bacterium]
GKIGLLTAKEVDQIVSGLEGIRKEIEAGTFPFSEALEDVHMNIERRLTERIGPAGEKLHTARSRNDQVATDLRMYVREAIDGINEGLDRCRKALTAKAKAHVDLILPGYTHLQHAQPILFAHYLLAYREMFARDGERMADGRKRVNVLPLGSGALAGTSFPLDREFVARELGFDGVTRNSLDGVSDRDFVIEFLSAGAILAMHLSRLSEDMILWASDEFGFVDLPDALCTGSSMMPQKKNPDVLELIRGKTGRVYGNLMALLTLMKGLPLSYNRDMQEDKEPLFDTVNTLQGALELIPRLIEGMTPRGEIMARAAGTGCMWATDMADYLVKKGLPFRKAHEVAGKIVGHCAASGLDVQRLSLDDLRRFSDLFEKDIFPLMELRAGVDSRKGIGGTGTEAVLRRIREIEEEEK